VKPISPSELAATQLATFPDDVVAVWNELIARRFDRTRAVVKQEEVVKALAVRMICDRARVFDAGWLNIEPLFQEQGWEVEYWKPAYNESGDAHFIFTPKAKR